MHFQRAFYLDVFWRVCNARVFLALTFSPLALLRLYFYALVYKLLTSSPSTTPTAPFLFVFPRAQMSLRSSDTLTQQTNKQAPTLTPCLRTGGLRRKITASSRTSTLFSEPTRENKLPYQGNKYLRVKGEGEMGKNGRQRLSLRTAVGGVWMGGRAALEKREEVTVAINNSCTRG